MRRVLIAFLLLLPLAAFAQSTLTNAYTWRTNLAPDLTLNQLFVVTNIHAGNSVYASNDMVAADNVFAEGTARTNTFAGPTRLADVALVEKFHSVSVGLFANFPGSTGQLTLTGGEIGPSPFLDRGGLLTLYGTNVSGSDDISGDAHLYGGTNGNVILDGRYCTPGHTGVQIRAPITSVSSNLQLATYADLKFGTNMIWRTDGATNVWLITLSPSRTTQMPRVDYVP